MIDPNKIKKSQARHIIKLLEQQTRAIIMSRLGKINPAKFADYFEISLRKMDELREYIFGTSDLVKLGYKWKLLKKKQKKSKKRR